MTDPRRAGTRRVGAVTIAAVLSAVWLVGTAVFLVTLGLDSSPWLAVAVAIALPLVAIWLAALLARQTAILHGEAQRLSEAADAMREATNVALSARPAAASAAPPPMRLTRPEGGTSGAPPPMLPEQKKTPSAEQPPEAMQASLPFSLDADGTRVTVAELSRALDFPDGPTDEEGFRALRLALRDARTRRLVQASQDVLTLLAQEGIYMDDLVPDRARPDLWRRFADGERGPEFAALGGIRDRSSLALSGARMRADPVFRDAAHHFLRLFDKMLAATALEATDAEIASFVDTRTARAFMLIGRVAGIFE